MHKIFLTNYDYDNVVDYLNNSFHLKNKIKIETLNSEFNLSIEEILDYSNDFDAIITQFKDFNNKKINNKVVINNKLILDKPNIKVIKKNNIIINNIAHYSLNEIADHTISLYLTLIRKLNYVKNITDKTGIFNYRIGKGIKKISNMNLGLLGFGLLSQKIFKKSVSFGFNKILIYDSDFNKNNKIDNAIFSNFNNFLKETDILIISPPLKKESYGKIGKKEFELLKEGSYIVNIYKDDLLNEAELYKNLNNGKIKGAALDVFSKSDSSIFYDKLFNLDNIIITPYISWYSDETNMKLLKVSINQIINHLS